MEYTGWCQNDVNAQGFADPLERRGADVLVDHLEPSNEKCTGLAQIARL